MIRMTVPPSLGMLPLMALVALASFPTDAGARQTACGSEVRAIEINKYTLHYFNAARASRSCSSTAQRGI